MMNFSKKIQIIFLLVLFFFSYSLLVNAAIVDDLKGKISDKTTELDKVKAEIAIYQKEINTLGGKSDTLENSIRKLNITRKRLEADIELTQIKINSTTSNIKKLALDISTKSSEIYKSNKAIGEMIRKMDEAETKTLIEVMLSNDTFSSFLNEIDNLKQSQNAVDKNLKQLEELKSTLEIVKSKSEGQKKILLSSRLELGDRKAITENNKIKKDKLLRDTHNKESNYKKILKTKQKLKEEFERDLLDYESQLKIAIDPNSIPKPGIRIFSPPLSRMSLKSCDNGGTGNCITQFFGNTKFSRTGAYDGKGHNGVDFRASIGTKVHSVLSGIVTGTGDTDVYKGCYSYGRWVLVKHHNGLSTLYAHFSLVKVKPGQIVSVGDVLGYSGESGYVTGPHLHLTTLVTKGVKIVRLGDIKKITHCKDARIPVASFNSYLNALDYL